MHTAPVSVVIPAYNVEGCIGTCLDSVLGQSKPPREVIVVDDGSTDTTVARLGKYAGSGVRCLTQRNSGPAAARNRGVAVATQPYVAFLDADDFWLPDFLQRTAEFLDTHPEAVAVSTGLMVRDAGGRERLLTGTLRNEIGSVVVLADFFAIWARHDHVRTGSVLIRRSKLLAAGGFREDLRVAEDLELWACLGTHGRWGFIADALWVGNPAASSALTWRRKYRERGRHCAEIADWESRVRPRLSAVDERAFAAVRGRVAASYVYARILAGDADGARRTAEQHLHEMPASRVRSLLHSGLSQGDVGWVCATATIRLWEDLKSIRLRFGAAGRAAARVDRSVPGGPHVTIGE